jgi:AcrR family transcriptional regulator
LFFRVCDDYIAAIDQIANQSTKPSSATAASRIQQSIHTLLVISTEARDMFPLILELWSVSASPHRHERVAASFRHAYSKFRRLIADQIRKGQRDGEFDRGADPSQVAAMIVCALDGTFLQAWFDPGLDPVRIGDQVVTMLLHSLTGGRRREISNRKPARLA